MLSKARNCLVSIWSRALREAVGEQIHLPAAVGCLGQQETGGCGLCHCHTPDAQLLEPFIPGSSQLPQRRSMLHSIPAGTAPAALQSTKCLWAGKGLICWSETGGQQQQRAEDEAKLPWLRWEPQKCTGECRGCCGSLFPPAGRKEPTRQQDRAHAPQIIGFEHSLPCGSQTQDSRVRKQGSGHPWGGGSILIPGWEHPPALSLLSGIHRIKALLLSRVTESAGIFPANCLVRIINSGFAF